MRTSTSTSSTATQAINRFGLDLHRALVLAGAEENGLFSPFSIQLVMGMVYAGAAGETRVEMRRVLHYPEEEQELHEGLARLTAHLTAAAERAGKLVAEVGKWAGTSSPVAPIELCVASRLFGQRGIAFLRPFLELVEQRYAAPLEELDIAAAAEEARATINRWVSESTRGKIRELVPPGALGPDTRLVLASALYLRAAWSHPFDERATKPMPFLIRGRERASVSTMVGEARYGYAKNDGFTAISLPYLAHEVQFLVLMPDAPNGLAALERELTPEVLAGCAGLSGRQVRLYLPRFELKPAAVELGELLQELGMKTAFDKPPGSADFSRMAPRTAQDYLALAKVFHGAYLQVNEEGTTAAAATAALMQTRSFSLPPKPIEVRIDRPFLFAIQETKSSACLLLGRVTDPR